MWPDVRALDFFPVDERQENFDRTWEEGDGKEGCLTCGVRDNHKDFITVTTDWNVVRVTARMFGGQVFSDEAVFHGHFPLCNRCASKLPWPYLQDRTLTQNR